MQVKAIENLESAPSGMSHFRYDSYHMGADVANDLLVMFGEFKHNPYIILCNKETGERTRIWLDLNPQDPDKGYWHMGRYHPEGWEKSEETVPMVVRKNRE